MTAAAHPNSPAVESSLARFARLLPPRLRDRLRFAKQSHAVRRELLGLSCTDAGSLRHAAATALGIGGRRIGFYPQVPYRNFVVFKALSVLGWSVERLSATSDVAVFWADATLFDANDPRLAQPGMINGRCLDISKRRVDATFAELAGYGVAVDPRTHAGPMVCKADGNGAHDGRIIEGPIETVEPQSVYQRVIRNEVPGGMIEDLRVPVIGDRLPLVYAKRRPIETRFANHNSSVALREVEAVFSPEEVSLILRFVAAFDLDYGEVDVLRDAGDGRIYIIDVNKTPFGPPNGLPQGQATEAVRRIAQALRTTWRAPGQ